MHIDATHAQVQQEHMANWLEVEYPKLDFLMRAPDWTPIALACEIWDRDVADFQDE